MKVQSVFALVVASGASLFVTQAWADCEYPPYAGLSLERAIHGCSSDIMEMQSNPSYAASTNAKAENFFYRGALYRLSGKLDLAIADYSKALSWNHNLVAAYEARGDAYEDAGDHAKAVADYGEADKQRGHQPSNSVTSCAVRATRGHPLERALADCNGALKHDPDDQYALQLRALVYYRMGDDESAITDCSALVDKEPRNADCLFIRGLAKTHAGDIAGGDADVAAAKDADYRIAETYALYGVKP